MCLTLGLLTCVNWCSYLLASLLSAGSCLPSWFEKQNYKNHLRVRSCWVMLNEHRRFRCKEQLGVWSSIALSPWNVWQCSSAVIRTQLKRRAIDEKVKRTTGRDISPRISHRSTIARMPTKMTTNTPTNFTLTVQASVTPTVDNQTHHCQVKALEWSNFTYRHDIWKKKRVHLLPLMLLNFTIAYTEVEMKNNIGGSSKMKRFSVIIPVSENIKR